MSDKMENSFITACKEGDIDRVRELLEDPGTDVHVNEDRAFRMACIYGHLEIVQLLLGLTGDRRVDVNYFHELAFQLSCENGQTEIVQLLLGLEDDRRVDVNVENASPFHCACASGCLEVIQILLDLEGDRRVDIHTGEDFSFRMACENGNLEVVQLLLGLTGDRWIDVHRNNELAFRTACEKGRTESVRFLLGLEGDRRIDVHAENEYGFRKACSEGNLSVVKLLLGLEGDRRIDVHTGYKSSFNPDGPFDFYLFHFVSGNNVAYPYVNYEESFQNACWKGHTEVVRLLLSLTGDRRIDVHANKEYSFRYACINNRLEIVQLLLSSGYDRLPSKSMFDEYYTNRIGGQLTWEEVLWNNRPLSARLTSWRHSHEAHRDARLVYAQARIGRPMELRRRLYLGKFAGGLYIRGKDGLTPREAAAMRGNTKCIAVIDEVSGEFMS